jgi:hypothetical protein
VVGADLKARLGSSLAWLIRSISNCGVWAEWSKRHFEIVEEA